MASLLNSFNSRHHWRLVERGIYMVAMNNLKLCIRHPSFPEPSEIRTRCKMLQCPFTHLPCSSPLLPHRLPLGVWIVSTLPTEAGPPQLTSKHCYLQTNPLRHRRAIYSASETRSATPRLPLIWCTFLKGTFLKTPSFTQFWVLT